MGVEELPSWVFFPDKERAEWVNTMLKQVFSKKSKSVLLTINFQYYAQTGCVTKSQNQYF